jgi:hypothetical protein
VMRISIPMPNRSGLSVSSAMALLTRRLEILEILSLDLADGASSSNQMLSLGLILCLLVYYRICPGRHIAFSSIWMSIAAILATLEIAMFDETMLPEDGRYFSAGIAVL